MTPVVTEDGEATTLPDVLGAPNGERVTVWRYCIPSRAAGGESAVVYLDSAGRFIAHGSYGSLGARWESLYTKPDEADVRPAFARMFEGEHEVNACFVNRVAVGKKAAREAHGFRNVILPPLVRLIRAHLASEKAASPVEALVAGGISREEAVAFVADHGEGRAWIWARSLSRAAAATESP